MGNFKPEDIIVANNSIEIFLYLLMRDYATSGEIEHILKEVDKVNAEDEAVFTNPFLAKYAKNISQRLED